MSVDLSIPGDPGAIRTLATWLDPELRDATFGVGDELSLVELDSGALWKGESGDAFRIAAGTVHARGDALPGFLSDSAEVFRAYADRLERGRETFDGFLDDAKAFGLDVDGRIVQNPVFEGPCPTEDAPRSEVEKWNAHQLRVVAYTELLELVGEFWGQLEAWLVDHMAPLVERIGDLAPIHDLLPSLTVGNEEVVAFALEEAEHRARRDLGVWREAYDTMQTRADDFTAGLRSGNPALRAASEAANPRLMREGLEELGSRIGALDSYAKVVPGVGLVVDIVAAGSAIAGGDSTSSAVIELVAGGAGASGAAAVVAGGPPAWVALASVAGGVAVGGGARWGYEALVPLDVRATIDEFFSSEPSLADEVLDEVVW